MATHAHSTRSPLLRPSAEAPALLGPELGRQPGPVTKAIRAMRAADPADLAIAAIQDGLTAHFADSDRLRVRDLRRRIAERIEADLALLDALDGDPDSEDCADDEPSLCGLDVTWPSHGGDDREAGDDNGIADAGGAFDQAQRYLRQGGDLYEASRLHWGYL